MEVKIYNIKLWIDIDKWQLEQLWFEFREKLMFMTLGITDKEVIKEAEEYLFNKYPQYERFNKEI